MRETIIPFTIKVPAAPSHSFIYLFILWTLTQVSQLISVPTLVARPSHSVCLTTGRSSQETHWNPPASLLLLSRRLANVRVSKKVFQPWTTTWINCKRLGLARLLPHSSLPYKNKVYTHCWPNCTEHSEHCWLKGLTMKKLPQKL